MDDKHITISGKMDGNRLDSRILEERIQEAVAGGYRHLTIQAYGQHGIGGRLWRAGDDPVHVRVEGHSGQRLGSLGFPNTVIEVEGPVSDDVGWLNAGAHIVVRGHAGNGACNAMAQGKVFVAGNIGSRGMTMTKQNPRFAPPELWVLGSVGDYFGEFMAGGIAVICGIDPQDPGNILGHRPLVGMVGGKVFFRGPHRGFSQADARILPIEQDDWQWLTSNLEQFLGRIGRIELLGELADADAWQLIVARNAREKTALQRRSLMSFRTDVWDKELGTGGLIGDLVSFDRSPVPLIPAGELRRYVPIWENRQYKAPCEAQCPTGIPVHDRWRLVREGRVDEAVNLALSYTPFPATVCGYLCPNLCMQACTRQSERMTAVDITPLGKASITASLPQLPEISGITIGIIGAGPAGLSIAWQLRLKGHAVTVFDTAGTIGGKIASVIPQSRIPEAVVTAELERIRQAIPHVHLQQRLDGNDFERLQGDYDFLVIAVGAAKTPNPSGSRQGTGLDCPGFSQTVQGRKDRAWKTGGHYRRRKRGLRCGHGSQTAGRGHHYASGCSGARLFRQGKAGCGSGRGCLQMALFHPGDHFRRRYPDNRRNHPGGYCHHLDRRCAGSGFSFPGRGNGSGICSSQCPVSNLGSHGFCHWRCGETWTFDRRHRIGPKGC